MNLRSTAVRNEVINKKRTLFTDSKILYIIKGVQDLSLLMKAKKEVEGVCS